MNSSSFLKYFPVPKYLQFPAVGFDVSDGSVKFIELINDGDNIKIGNFGIRTFEDDLTGTLNSIQKEYGFERVNVSIPEEESFFVRIRLPFIAPKEIRGAIELQIEEYIPYPANEVEFDYEILKIDSRPGGYIDVNISALPKKILKSYVDVFKRSNLEPISLMVEADATTKSTVPMDNKEVVMVVNIGRVNTVLSIITGKSVWFSYTFRFGGDTLVKRLEETFHLSHQDAERIKNEKGIIDSPNNQDVFGCLLPMVSGIRDEIKRHRTYWAENKEEFFMAKDMGGDVSKIIICGSQSIIPGLTDYLSSSLGLRASLANPWVNIFHFDEYIPPINRKDSLEYATAVGLALNSLK